MTSRDSAPDLDRDLASFLSDLGREPCVELVTLSGLTQPEIAALIDGRTDRPAADVRAMTGGNPLLTLELVATGPHPGPLAGLLERRFERLTADQRHVLDVATIIGAEFEADLIADATHQGVDSVLDALEAGEAAGIIANIPARPGRFAFLHELFRSSRYASLPSSQRLRHHHSVAAALNSRDDETVLPALAYHSYSAAPLGDPADAIELCRRAGQIAQRKLAYEEAVEQYRRALALLDLSSNTDKSTRLHLDIAVAVALGHTGDETARDQLHAAVETARRQGDHEALISASYALTVTGEPIDQGQQTDPRLIAAFQDALDALPPGPSQRRIRLLTALGGELMTLDLTRARELLREAIDSADTLGASYARAEALMTYRQTLMEPALTDEGRIVAEQLIGLGEQLDRPEFTRAGSARLVDIHAELGDLTSMRTLIENLERGHEHSRHPMFQLSRIAHRVTLNYLLGDLAAAEAGLDRFLAIGEQPGVDPFNFYAPNLLVIRIQQGRIAELVSLLEEAVANQPHHRAYAATLCSALARVRRIDDARHVLDTLAAVDYEMPHNLTWFVGNEQLVDGIDILADTSAGNVIRARLSPYAGRIVHFAVGASRPVDQLLAQLALIRDDPEEAIAAATRAISASRRRGTPTFLGRELVLLAAANRRQGDSADQLKPLIAEARELAERTGAHIIQDEIHRYGLTDA